MERQREKPEEVPKELKEKAEKELEGLRNELARLRKLKKEKEQLEQRKSKEEVVVKQEEELETDDVEVDALKYLEDSFEKVEDLLSSDLGEIDHKAFKQHAKNYHLMKNYYKLILGLKKRERSSCMQCHIRKRI